MRAVFLVTTAVLSLLCAGTAQGLNVYYMDQGAWVQYPPEGGLGSTVQAFGSFTSSPSQFMFDAVKLEEATPSSHPDYTWQTTYDVASIMMSVDSWMIVSADYAINYNNNDPGTGLPSEFLFRGGGTTLTGTPYAFEAWWNMDDDPPEYIPGFQVGADLTGARLMVGNEIPEPATVGLLLVGLGGLLVFRRRRH